MVSYTAGSNAESLELLKYTIYTPFLSYCRLGYRLDKLNKIG